MKAAKIEIDWRKLQEILGIDLKRMALYSAAIDYRAWLNPQLALIIVGEDLPDAFTVEDGMPVREADIIIKHDRTETEIRLRS